MQTLLYLEMNLFSITIVAVIFFSSYKRLSNYRTEHKLFLSMLVLDAVILLLDSAMWLLDAKSGQFLHAVYYAVTVVYYILNPVICMVWAYYADYQIYSNRARLKKKGISILLPALVNTVLSLLDTFGNFTFSINQDNVYQRGRLFWVMPFCAFLYLIYTVFLILKNRRKISKKRYHALLGFVLPPFIAGILQSLFYGLSLIWICSTISVLVIFINLQNDQMNTDHLTGLYNRRQVDFYLQEKIKSSSNKIIIGIMLDINSFKKINDQYGHSAGDQALEFTANLLKKSFDKNDLIARYGGDEFLILTEMDNIAYITPAIEKLHKNLMRFNSKNVVPYTLSFSIGYDAFDCHSKDSVNEFLVHIDRLMYEDKRSMKRL